MGDYLARRGLISSAEQAEAAALRGGVSNQVIKVILPEQTLVVKQARPRLRVAQEWLSNVDRIFAEYEFLRVLNAILPAHHVPQALFVDRDYYVYAMSCAPEQAVNWKLELLAGRVDLDIASQLGELLALIHRRSAADRKLVAPFADQTVFYQLRVDPYYRAMLSHHPDLKPQVKELIASMNQRRHVLVHGDYSPKNILVWQGRPILLDFEVVHWGDAAFDLAFLTNHLALKCIHQPQFLPHYQAAIRRFWATYCTTRWSHDGDRVPPLPSPEKVPSSRRAIARGAHASEIRTDTDPDLTKETLRHLACLMLARIDGKSPAEYLSERSRSAVRALSRTLLQQPPPTWDDYLERLEAAARTL